MVNKNKDLKICMLIDVGIPANRSVMKKEAEEKLKYKIVLFCPCIVNDYNQQMHIYMSTFMCAFVGTKRL